MRRLLFVLFILLSAVLNGQIKFKLDIYENDSIDKSSIDDLYNIENSTVRKNYTVDIRKNKSKTNDTNLTEEELFIEKHFPYIPVCEWKKGFRFMAKSRYSNMSDIAYIYPLNIPDSMLYNKDIEGKIFIFSGFKEMSVPLMRKDAYRMNNQIKDIRKRIEKESDETLKNILISMEDHYNNEKSSYMTNRLCAILKSESSGLEYIYEFNSKISDFCNKEKDMSDFVFLNDIDKACELLIGKTLYFNYETWFTANNTITLSTKYIPVVINNIGLSHDGYCKIAFETSSSDEFYIKVKLSGTNESDYNISLPDFANVFSFKDPKLKYPNITRAKWKLIQNRDIEIGMSKTECRLSYGEPDDINSTLTGYGNREQWVYENQFGNTYLYFRNGRLISIQR